MTVAAFWYMPAPVKATGPQDLTHAKTLGHWWCSSCKIMGVGNYSACTSCGGSVKTYAPLERT